MRRPGEDRDPEGAVFLRQLLPRPARDGPPQVAAQGAVSSRQKIVALYAPQKAKQTVMIGGSPADAARELVKRLREEARVL